LLTVAVKESDERREWWLKITRGEEEQEEEEVFQRANISEEYPNEKIATFRITWQAHITHVRIHANQSTLLSLSLSLSLSRKKTCASLPRSPLPLLRRLEKERRLIHHRDGALGAEDITRRRRYPKRDG
jgi:hypothetical protein